MHVVDSDSMRATVELTTNELRVLNNALNEVCHGPDAIEEWEFQTRMGVERHEAQSLLENIRHLLSG
jgi:hypothetical protein